MASLFDNCQIAQTIAHEEVVSASPMDESLLIGMSECLMQGGEGEDMWRIV